MQRNIVMAQLLLKGYRLTQTDCEKCNCALLQPPAAENYQPLPLCVYCTGADIISAAGIVSNGVVPCQKCTPQGKPLNDVSMHHLERTERNLFVDMHDVSDKLAGGSLEKNLKVVQYLQHCLSIIDGLAHLK